MTRGLLLCGECKVIRDGDDWCVNITVQKEAKLKRQYATILPIDMGVRKLATTIEDGKPQFYGKDVRRTRGNYYRLRRSVGKGRIIKKWRDKEQKTVRHQVHAMTRRIVERAKRAKAIIVFGNLEGIRAGSWETLQPSSLKSTVLPVQAAADIEGGVGRNTRAGVFGNVHVADLPRLRCERTACHWKILMPKLRLGL
jgi:hypothetical protein